MTFVVTENCIKCKYMDCVEVCPVDCFHEGPNFLVIDPDECIDCTLCEPECPVEAIFSEEELPAGQEQFKELNKELSHKWPVITEKGGVVKFQDIIENKTLTEQTDEATGIAQRVVTEYRATGRSKEDLRPRITLLDDKSGEAARYMLAPGAMLSVEEGQTVEAGEVLARVTREAAKTRDITGGLPRVAELFEARKPK